MGKDEKHINLNNFSNDVAKTHSVLITTSNPCDIVNTINNYLTSVTKRKTKENINYSHKHYSDYLSENCKNSFFAHPTIKDNIASIVSSLDKND